MLYNALKIAENSVDYRTKVGCVITDKRGKIIASGVNSRKTHPLQKEMAEKVGLPEKVFLHAEIAALVRCRDEPHTVYVGRITHDGESAVSRPCPICMMSIVESGAKRIVFMNEDGLETSVDLSE
jgi:tRNA(Arg) A34 adenosine deaminase TadA